MNTSITFPDVFRATRWPDLNLDRHGFPVDHPYIDTFYLPIVGPAGTWAYRKLGGELIRRPNGITVDLAEFAAGIGVGSGARRPVIHRTINRLIRFGIADWRDEQLTVRLALAPLSPPQLSRLPDRLRLAHRAMVVDHEQRRTRRAPDANQSMRDHRARFAALTGSFGGVERPAGR